MIPILGDLLKPVLDKALSFIPDPAKKAEAALALQTEADNHQEVIMKALLAADQGQIDVNKVEAASPSIFVSGWRPACGWVCAFALGWQYILAPMANWVVEVLKVTTVIPKISSDGLMELLFGLLGLAGMRTYERVKDVHRS